MKETGIVDVWMQHPTMRFINHPMFESLKRWTGTDKFTEDLPGEFTIDTMNQAGVEKGMVSA